VHFRIGSIRIMRGRRMAALGFSRQAWGGCDRYRRDDHCRPIAKALARELQVGFVSLPGLKASSNFLEAKAL